MRQYILNVVRAVLGLSESQEGHDPLFDAVEEFVTAEPGQAAEDAYEHLKALYGWYKEQE